MVSKFGVEIDVHGARNVAGEVVGASIGAVESPPHIEDTDGREHLVEVAGGDQVRRRGHGAQGRRRADP